MSNTDFMIWLFNSWPAKQAFDWIQTYSSRLFCPFLTAHCCVLSIFCAVNCQPANLTTRLWDAQILGVIEQLRGPKVWPWLFYFHRFVIILDILLKIVSNISLRITSNSIIWLKSSLGHHLGMLMWSGNDMLVRNRYWD